MKSALATLLDRHATRRIAGVPTVSLLVGSVEAGVTIWRLRQWATVVATRATFPFAEWIRSIAERIDLSVAAVQYLARKVQRDPEEFLAAWRVKTDADRELFWSTLAPTAGDDQLLDLALLAVDPGSRSSVANALSNLGERIVPTIVRLVPRELLPGLLFVADSTTDVSSIGPLATDWAMRLPTLPIAVAVPAEAWNEYLANSPESRAKAILKEGVISLPEIEATEPERDLTDTAALGRTLAAMIGKVADPKLVESAVAAVRATCDPPATQAEDDAARSAAERFLFEFLESLPETAGQFELNGTLDFRFGSRPAEVDIICRAPRIAIELDGYFHFVTSDRYRRDRSKDWELQRRGFIVLRFLAEDVVPQMEFIRDRILEALIHSPHGACP